MLTGGVLLRAILLLQPSNDEITGVTGHFPGKYTSSVLAKYFVLIGGGGAISIELSMKVCGDFLGFFFQ